MMMMYHPYPTFTFMVMVVGAIIARHHFHPKQHPYWEQDIIIVKYYHGRVGSLDHKWKRKMRRNGENYVIIDLYRIYFGLSSLYLEETATRNIIILFRHRMMIYEEEEEEVHNIIIIQVEKVLYHNVVAMMHTPIVKGCCWQHIMVNNNVVVPSQCL